MYMYNQVYLKANLMDLWLKEMWPPCSTDCNPVDYFMWCVDLMTDLDREVIFHAGKKFKPWIEAVMEATRVFIKYMCILYAYKVFLKFSSKCIHPNYLLL